MAKSNYVQVGLTAMRSSLGDFLPPIELYIKVNEKRQDSSFMPCEEGLLSDVARVVTHKLEKDEQEALYGKI